ncbi:MAG: CapA family protein [Lachnospiraceae bacterium]|nr:CapA family protein [Lachnospiraceae bacterium]
MRSNICTGLWLKYLTIAVLCLLSVTGCRIRKEPARDIREAMEAEEAADADRKPEDTKDLSNGNDALVAEGNNTDNVSIAEQGQDMTEDPSHPIIVEKDEDPEDPSQSAIAEKNEGPEDAPQPIIVEKDEDPEDPSQPATAEKGEDPTDTPQPIIVDKDEDPGDTHEPDAPDETTGPADEAGSVEIVMVGDILLHMRVENSGKDPETGKYDFRGIFEHTKDKIGSADVAIVNQEVIIGGEELGISGYPTFNAPYAIGDALSDAGFDVVCHATNHSLDKGKRGLVNCLEFWRNNHPGIMVTGIYDNAEDALPEKLPLIERNGIKIAILNYTYGTNGINPPSDMPFAVSMLNEERVRAQLELAEKEADFTIVCPHWGTEYNLGISAEQEKWASLFRECGADAVIGTHPHVIEPLVFYEEGEDEKSPEDPSSSDPLADQAAAPSPEFTNNHGNGDMPVFYSLGNFVNWTQTSKAGIARRMVGGMARLEISRKENDEVSIDECEVIDLVCHLQHGFGKVTVYPLSDYTKELASQNEVLWQDPGFSVEYCEKLCDEVYLNEDYHR